MQYWPSEGTEQYSLISVTLQVERLARDYVIRKFSLTKNMVPITFVDFIRTVIRYMLF